MTVAVVDMIAHVSGLGEWLETVKNGLTLVLAQHMYPQMTVDLYDYDVNVDDYSRAGLATKAFRSWRERAWDERSFHRPPTRNFDAKQFPITPTLKPISAVWGLI